MGAPPMKIAVTRQSLPELPLAQGFQESARAPGPRGLHPLDGTSLLLTAGAAF